MDIELKGEFKMHKVQPNQKVRLFAIEIAVPADAELESVFDEISALLTENGMCNNDSHILDWHYLIDYQPVIEAGVDVEEAEIFENSPLSVVLDYQNSLKCQFCKTSLSSKKAEIFENSPQSGVIEENYITIMGSLVCYQCWDTIAAIAVYAKDHNLPQQQEPYNNPLSDDPRSRVLLGPPKPADPTTELQKIE